MQNIGDGGDFSRPDAWSGKRQERCHGKGNFSMALILTGAPLGQVLGIWGQKSESVVILTKAGMTF
jgi:hypothetical protein